MIVIAKSENFMIVSLTYPGESPGRRLDYDAVWPAELEIRWSFELSVEYGSVERRIFMGFLIMQWSWEGGHIAAVALLERLMWARKH